jgi:hypothetical protein
MDLDFGTECNLIQLWFLGVGVICFCLLWGFLHVICLVLHVYINCELMIGTLGLFLGKIMSGISF